MQEVKYTSKTFLTTNFHAHSVNELSHRIANDFVNKATSNWHYSILE